MRSSIAVSAHKEADDSPKPVTATAVMMLAEEGKLRLDEPVGPAAP